MIKSQNEWRELPVDALYYMQSYFLFEFQRAKCGSGNYAMKQNLSLAVTDVKMPPFLPLEEIIKRTKTNTENKPCKVEGVKLLSSQTSLAKWVW